MTDLELELVGDKPPLPPQTGPGSTSSRVILIGALVGATVIGVAAAVFLLRPNNPESDAAEQLNDVLETTDSRPPANMAPELRGLEAGQTILEGEAQLIWADGDREMSSVELLIDDIIFEQSKNGEPLTWAPEPGRHTVRLRVAYDDGSMAETDTLAVIVQAVSTTSSAPPTTARALMAEFLSPSEFIVTASSETEPVPSKALTYWASNIVDDDLNTAWNHNGQVTDANGEYIAIGFVSPEIIDSIHIINGYAKSTQIYFLNHRVRSLRITATGTSGSWSLETVLQDTSALQIIQVDEEIPVQNLRLEIISTYAGSRYDDVAITELDIVVLR